MIKLEKNNREVFHNRDIKVKISLINHVQYFFNLQGIDEKPIQLLPTEWIDKKYSNLRMDFLVKCVSGNIYNIEGETQSVIQLPRPIEVVDCELFSQSTG